MTRFQRFTIDHVYLIVALGALVAAMVGLWFALRPASPAEPPIHWTAAEYTPERHVYAPGDTIVYTPTLRMLYGGEVAGLRSFWDVAHVRPARTCDNAPTPTYEINNNFPAGEYGNLVTGAPSVALPIPALPPGDYTIETNVHGFGVATGQTGYVVRFSVTQACG